jgi:iron complex transport system permease protein
MRSKAVGAALLSGFVLLAGICGLLLGAAPLSPATVWNALTDPGADPAARSILVSLRLPRVAAGILTGASLAVSGTLFQALLRNPLAEPYLLGVSSGAAFGAVGALTLGFSWLGSGGLVLAGLAGSLLAIAIVFRVAYAVGRLDTHIMILAGVVVAAFFGAGVMLLLTMARGEAMRAAVLWTMGSLSGVSWEMTVALALYAGVSTLTALALARHLNALALGEETAAHLGTRVETVKRASFLLASLLAAAAVSVAGVIGFIGLVVPHAVRLVWGADHRYLIPFCFLAGGGVLVLADTLARTTFRPLELPVGVVTALLGVPLFLVLLRRRHA